jgi:hypothetical protein
MLLRTCIRRYYAKQAARQLKKSSVIEIDGRLCSVQSKAVVDARNEQLVSLSVRTLMDGSVRPVHVPGDQMFDVKELRSYGATVTSVYRIDSKYEGGRQRVKFYADLDAPLLDDEREYMYDAHALGGADLIDSLGAGKRLVIDYIQDQPVYMREPPQKNNDKQ